MSLPPALLQVSHFSTVGCWLSPVDVRHAERPTVLVGFTHRWMCSREDPRIVREDALLVCTLLIETVALGSLPKGL
jgi:hypothetical protein